MARRAWHALLAVFIVGLGVSITLSQTALAGLTLIWLWRLADPATRRSVPLPLGGPVLAFSGASLLSAVTSGHVGESLFACKSLLLVLALYVVVDAVGDATGADRFLSALSVVGALAAVGGLLQVLSCPVAVAPGGLVGRFFHRCDRAHGFFGIYMTLAGVLTMLVVAVAPRLLPGPARRPWAAGPWVLMVLALGATYVRGAWLGFGAGMLTLLALARRGRGLLVVALLAVGVVALLGPAHVRQRVLSMTDPEEATIRERFYMWRSGVTMWREHPVLGHGPGSVRRDYERYALAEAVKKRTAHLHNTPLQILVERGLLGLAAWLWIWVAFYARVGALLRGARSEREHALAAGALAAITGFLVTGLSEYSFGDSEVVLVAWVLVALPFAAARSAAPEGAA